MAPYDQRKDEIILATEIADFTLLAPRARLSITLVCGNFRQSQLFERFVRAPNDQTPKALKK
jgi:hypothetical protein